MKYDDVKLDVCWLNNDSVALLRYVPRSRTPETRLILDFKEYQQLALNKVRNLALQAFSECEEDLEEFRRGYLVALPSHAKNSVNQPCEYLCAALALAFRGQLVHLRQALTRVVEVRKSATARSDERPDYTDHIQSIAYTGPQLDPHERIIMVDDVLTRGETSSACRDILRTATGCKDVRGFFVSRTEYQ